MRCEGLSSEHRTIVWNRGFEAFGVDAFLGILTFFLARFFCVADAGDVSEQVSESASEDVAFVRWHLEGFLDGVGEAVVGELEVFEHCMFMSN